jgi:prepilin-type N-terminal cleavage/methylation domain-containing protein
MPKHLFNNRCDSGFTLLEILVVVVGIGVLSAIAAPSWLTFVNTRRLSTSQEQVYRAMQQAKSQAIRQKLTWQASFREKDGVVQWAIHPADADKFIPAQFIANNNLWHNLESNIHIDTNKNKKGEYETTLRKETSNEAWRIMFNYQGCPVYKAGDECTETSLKTLGQITLYSKNSRKTRRCVYVSTLIGAMRTGREHLKANKNGKYCY